ncbi:MAG TPA: M14 family zinc carboxypeptidase [Polyangia bacterium]|nr:M14 family zinc carboxypeptidase [Polyangia bacterium]
MTEREATPAEATAGEATSRLAAVAALGFPEIGRSSLGRPIFGRRFGGPGAPLLVMGGIHGDEPASVDALLELAGRLGAGTPPLWLIPAANPDGLLAGRKNSARDVDLNRNFPARSFAAAHAPGYFPGPAPLSEPETRAIAAVVEGLGGLPGAAGGAPIAGAVAVHAPFACVNYDGPAGAWAEAVAAACGWPARGDIGYPTPGSFGSWLGVDRGLPVLTLELPPGPLVDFRNPVAAALDAALSRFFSP